MHTPHCSGHSALQGQEMSSLLVFPVPSPGLHSPHTTHGQAVPFEESAHQTRDDGLQVPFKEQLPTSANDQICPRDPYIPLLLGAQPAASKCPGLLSAQGGSIFSYFTSKCLKEGKPSVLVHTLFSSVIITGSPFHSPNSPSLAVKLHNHFAWDNLL